MIVSFLRPLIDSQSRFPIKTSFSKRLQALIDKDEKEAQREVGRIGWDVFIDGQDWKLTALKITTVANTVTSASAGNIQEFRHAVRYAV
jgi:hypothetical protein